MKLGHSVVRRKWYNIPDWIGGVPRVPWLAGLPDASNTPDASEPSLACKPCFVMAFC